MKIYFYELYKIAKAKMFWGIVAVLFAFSLFVFGIQQSNISGYADAKDVFAHLVREYKDTPIDEALPDIEEKYVEYEIRTLRLMSINDESNAVFLSIYEESHPDIYSEIMSSEENMSLEELEKTRFAYWMLLDNVQHIAGYEQYIDNVQENAETMMTVSIFAQEGTFTYNNILKTAEDFSELKNLNLEYGSDKGIVEVTDYTIGDMLLVAIVFVLCIFLFSEEQGSGMLNLIKTSKRGRLHVIAAKLLALVTVTVIIGIAYVTVLYIFGHGIYGFGDIQRYVQSMKSFQNCGVEISVKQFLIYSAITKIAVLIGVGMFFTVIFVLFRGSAALTYLVSILPIGIMWVLYTSVPSNAVFNHVKYINPFNFMNTYGLYGRYTNLNFFSLPINVLDMLPVVASIMLIICVIASCVIFAKMREISRRNVLGGLWEKISSIWRSKNKSVSLFLEEGFKIFVQGKVLLMLIVVAIVGTIMVTDYQKDTFDVDELVYRKYLRNITGEGSEDKFRYLEKQQAEFDNIPILIAQYQADYDSGKITRIELQEKVSYIQHTLGMQQKGFEMAQRDAEYVKRNNVWFTDQITANAWFDNMENDTLNGLLFVVAAIICLSPVFSMDYKRKVRPVLLSTKNGRVPLVRAKLLWSIVVLAILYVLVYLPQYINLSNGYGAPEWNAPVQSIQRFENFSGQITILEFYVRTHILRFIMIVMMGMVFAFISVKVRKQLIVILISTVVFAIPLVLQQQGVELRYFTFNNTFLINSSFINDAEMRKSIMNLAAIMTIGIAGIWLTFADSETTKRRKLI